MKEAEKEIRKAADKKREEKIKRRFPFLMELELPGAGTSGSAREEPVYTAQALQALQNEHGVNFIEQCTDRKIDVVGLKRLIEKFVEEKEETLFRGSPDVFLEQLVLTTSFQVILDASAGTYHIFRFLPVLVPPTLSVNPDHTHQLKITFKGVKGRGSPRNREALRQKCLTRLQGVPGAADECNTPSSLLLESVIEAVESSKAGG